MNEIDFVFEDWNTLSGGHFGYKLLGNKTGIGMSLIESSYGLLTSEPEADYVHHIALFAALLCACIVIGHLCEESRWMNESITALAIVSYRLLI